jgi:hypothetical protein
MLRENDVWVLRGKVWIPVFHATRKTIPLRQDRSDGITKADIEPIHVSNDEASISLEIVE